MTKICSICKQELPIELFYKRGDHSGKYRSECKSCQRKQRVCPICGIEHTSTYTKSKSDICPTCYPTYRLAYNMKASAKYRANKAGLECTIDVLDIYYQLLKPCPMTGFTYVFNGVGDNIGNRKPCSPSVDRIDPTKGYTKENSRVVSWWYNVTKQRFSDEEVLNLCTAIVNSSEMKNVQNVENMEKTIKETT